ncbi:hypothetical protein CH354_00015 [Leptospira levettii]|uniref:hypothetical protein n=1 Tax=Leptospira levettii TaxID=2023178 RepID=UPI000C29F6C3|nr:hypothetical protein [Leptospira levettii]MCG6148299.1 hypothetical protein [Leptospira levettii]PJZ37695.1 hypothetical protein CH354_00015 [Leptospira levettii]PJZ90454.1 hypothetical protein CH368_01750 [Leptospira levettii]PKA01552.1 hypothetical protein CH369_07310 [Leptospira levettii]
MKKQKLSKNTICAYLIFSFLITFFGISCRDASTDSGWVPLSLITVTKNVEDQEKLNQCMGVLPPGYYCTADLTPYPTNILRVDLRLGNEQISTLNTASLPYYSGGCTRYYEIVWNDATIFKRTTLYFWRGNKQGVCAIQFQKTNGETKNYLLNLPEEEGIIEVLKEVSVDGFTLTFSR